MKNLLIFISLFLLICNISLAAAQGLGYGSFADAVAAYNEKYGTNYTAESAKEALEN